MFLLPASNLFVRKWGEISKRYHLFIKAFYKQGSIRLPQALIYLHSVKESNVMPLRTNEKASKEIDIEMNGEIPEDYKERHYFSFSEYLFTITMPA
jgi:hypothetical protein